MSQESDSVYTDWHTVEQLIRSQQYAQATDLLQAMEQTAQAHGERFRAMTAATIRQICLACDQCHAEIKWHQQAEQAVIQREHMLRRQAQTILTALFDQHSSRFSPSDVPVDFHFAKREVGENAMVSQLWVFIQRILSAIPHFATLESIPLPEPQTHATAEAPLPQNMTREELPAGPTESTPALQFETPQHTGAVDKAPAPIETIATEPMSPTPIHRTTREDSVAETSAASLSVREVTDVHSAYMLAVYCLGPFQIYQENQPVTDWPSSKGQSIFKYLVTHRERPVAKEVLMELFWPDAGPDAARNNLNVAIYGLRRALRKDRPNRSHVLFQQDYYLLNPDLSIWVDVEEFAYHVNLGRHWEEAGDLPQAIRAYRTAEALYRGDFLVEDRYDDWPIAQRQSLQTDYLKLLEWLSDYYLAQNDLDACILMADKMLAVDLCREDAHRHLMRCYSRQGQYPLALRQYHTCVEVLLRELDVPTSAVTDKLYEQIRRRQAV